VSIKVKNVKGKKAKKEIAKKVSLFHRAPDHCLVCETPFDRKNREMAMTWYVVVREKEKKVNLYCPSCWGVAVETIQEIQNDQANS